MEKYLIGAVVLGVAAIVVFALAKSQNLAPEAAPKQASTRAES